MKKVKLNIILFGFILVILFGCKKDNNTEKLFFEIGTDGLETTIIHTINNIEFAFCMLNEDSIPSTVFSEGENFIFLFSFRNIFDESIVVTTEFIDQNFYRVFRTIDNKDYGKPWTGLWCHFDGAPHEIVLASSEIKELKCPWLLTNNNYPDYPICMSEGKENMEKGIYYTYIDLNFHYTVNGKKKVIKNIILQINFEIE